MNHRVIMANLPTGGGLSASDFRMEESAIPECEPGTLLCKTIAIFIGSALRRVMNSYLKPGMVVTATGVARVLASQDPSYAGKAIWCWRQLAGRNTLSSSRPRSPRSSRQATTPSTTWVLWGVAGWPPIMVW